MAARGGFRCREVAALRMNARITRDAGTLGPAYEQAGVEFVEKSFRQNHDGQFRRRLGRSGNEWLCERGTAGSAGRRGRLGGSGGIRCCSGERNVRCGGVSSVAAGLDGGCGCRGCGSQGEEQPAARLSREARRHAEPYRAAPSLQRQGSAGLEPAQAVHTPQARAGSACCFAGNGEGSECRGSCSGRCPGCGGTNCRCSEVGCSGGARPTRSGRRDGSRSSKCSSGLGHDGDRVCINSLYPVPRTQCGRNA